MLRACIDYHAVTAVYKDRRFLLMRLDRRGVYVIPLRCFENKELAQQALLTIQAGIRLAKHQPAGGLALEPRPCLWRAAFTSDAMLMGQLAAVWFPKAQRHNRKDPVYWLTTLAPALVLGVGSLGMFAMGSPVVAGVLGGLTAVYLLVMLMALLRNKPPANLQILPASAGGESLVEVNEQGVRWCTRFCDSTTPYRHLCQLYVGDGFVLFYTKGLRLAAYAPLAALQGQDVQALAAYVNGQIGQRG